MANVKDLIVSGAARIIGKTYSSGGFVGNLEGTVNGHAVSSDVPSGAVFTDTNTWRPLGTTADTACAGNDSRLSNSRPANGGNADTVDNKHASDFATSDHSHTYVSSLANNTTSTNAPQTQAVVNGGSAIINALTVGTDTPQDADYFVSQYAGGGNATTSYHRKPMSSLWEYIKGKVQSLGYTGNTGTVTSVSVSMNGASKGTVTTSGTIDLGTVITSHQDIKYPRDVSYNCDLIGVGYLRDNIFAIKNGDIFYACIPIDNNIYYDIYTNAFYKYGNSTFTKIMENQSYSDATTSASGLMSASDKTKLDGIASGGIGSDAFILDSYYKSVTVASGASQTVSFALNTKEGYEIVAGTARSGTQYLVNSIIQLGTSSARVRTTSLKTSSLTINLVLEVLWAKTGCFTHNTIRL